YGAAGVFFFFFQAEDGIRDFHVTGVQTCALPIYVKRVERPKAERRNPSHIGATMPGTVVAVLVSPGEPVAKGQALVVTEAMKVEQTIQAPRAGTVTEVLVKAGDSIQAGDLLLIVEPSEEE